MLKRCVWDKSSFLQRTPQVSEVLLIWRRFVPPIEVQSESFLGKADNLVMSSDSLGLSLLPDDFLGSSLANCDLNDSGGSAGRVGVDGDSEVFSETVL